jgi:chloride channel 3/4/5
MLAVAGGGLGSLLIHLNVKAAVYRKKSIISQWPLVEVLVVAGVTAFTSYPVSLNLISLILILISY